MKVARPMQVPNRRLRTLLQVMSLIQMGNCNGQCNRYLFFRFRVLRYDVEEIFVVLKMKLSLHFGGEDIDFPHIFVNIVSDVCVPQCSVFLL